jgi:hypothetical protein
MGGDDGPPFFIQQRRSRQSSVGSDLANIYMLSVWLYSTYIDYYYYLQVLQYPDTVRLYLVVCEL